MYMRIEVQPAPTCPLGNARTRNLNETLYLRGQLEGQCVTLAVQRKLGEVAGPSSLLQCTVIAVLVSVDGENHPYQLDGNSCTDGIFKKVVTIPAGEEKALVRLDRVMVRSCQQSKWREAMASKKATLENFNINIADPGVNFSAKTVKKLRINFYLPEVDNRTEASTTEFQGVGPAHGAAASQSVCGKNLKVTCQIDDFRLFDCPVKRHTGHLLEIEPVGSCIPAELIDIIESRNLDCFSCRFFVAMETQSEPAAESEPIRFRWGCGSCDSQQNPIQLSLPRASSSSAFEHREPRRKQAGASGVSGQQTQPVVQLVKPPAINLVQWQPVLQPQAGLGPSVQPPAINLVHQQQQQVYSRPNIFDSGAATAAEPELHPQQPEQFLVQPMSAGAASSVGILECPELLSKDARRTRTFEEDFFTQEPFPPAAVAAAPSEEELWDDLMEIIEREENTS
uniref:Arrestin_C domain-containing protein n=1 Tax=Macrostomum lignano TaxID=282301 RepID=A0A1I8G4H4_9PLAT